MRVLFVFAALAAAHGGASLAQSTPDRDLDRAESRIERRTEREPRAVRGLEQGPAKHWTLTLGTPFKFNSNVANANTGEQSALYIDPSVDLAGEWDLGGAVLSVDGAADSQFFSAHSENDNSTQLWAGRLTVPSGPISVYADYTGLSIYDGFFEDHAVTAHQFAGGMKGTAKLSSATSLTIDGSLTRREASLETVEFYRGSLSGRLKHALSEATSLIVLTRGRYADFTGGTSSGRTDKNLLSSVTLAHTLPGGGYVDFGVSFERNWSNAAGKDYSTWDIGPSVSFETTF